MITDEVARSEFRELQRLEILASHAPWYVARIATLLSREAGCPNIISHQRRAEGWLALLQRYSGLTATWQIDRARLAARILGSVYDEIKDAENTWAWANRAAAKASPQQKTPFICDAPGPEGI